MPGACKPSLRCVSAARRASIVSNPVVIQFAHHRPHFGDARLQVGGIRALAVGVDQLCVHLLDEPNNGNESSRNRYDNAPT